MTRRRAVAIAVAAAVLALAVPAAAYVRTRSACGAALFWANPAVTYVLSRHAASLAPSCGDPTGDGPALDAVKASFSAWEVSCGGSARQLVYGGRIDATKIGLGSEGEHMVVFRQGFCSVVAPTCMQDPNADCATQFNCFEDRSAQDKRIVALTSVLYDQNSGRIVDADIEVNGWDGQASGQSLATSGGGPTHGWYFTCNGRPGGVAACTTYGQPSNPGDPDCFYMDLQNTVTHEAGGGEGVQPGRPGVHDVADHRARRPRQALARAGRRERRLRLDATRRSVRLRQERRVRVRRRRAVRRRAPPRRRRAAAAARAARPLALSPAARGSVAARLRPPRA